MTGKPRQHPQPTTQHSSQPQHCTSCPSDTFQTHPVPFRTPIMAFRTHLAAYAYRFGVPTGARVRDKSITCAVDVWLTWHAHSSNSVAYRAPRAPAPLATLKDLHRNPKRSVLAKPWAPSPPGPTNPTHLGHLGQWHWPIGHPRILFSPPARAAGLPIAKRTRREVQLCTLSQCDEQAAPVGNVLQLYLRHILSISG